MGIEKTDAAQVSLSAENVTSSQEGIDILPNFTSPQFLVDYDYPSVTALRDELSGLFKKYDFVLIDCPPAMNMNVVNALLASDGVLLPALLDVLSLEGLSQVLGAIERLMKDHQHNLNITGVLPVMVDTRRQLTTEVKSYIEKNFNVPVLKNHIRMNVKTAEAPSHGKSVIAYEPKSNGAIDYKAVAKEFLELIK